VLINNGTASSAEMIAISFMGIPDVKLFGSASYGATTENNEFQLDDGSLLFLCTGIYVTRDLKKFGSKIQPDKYVSENPNSKSDKVLREALKWIKTQKYKIKLAHGRPPAAQFSLAGWTFSRHVCPFTKQKPV